MLVTNYFGVEPRLEKRESKITFMCMLKLKRNNQKRRQNARASVFASPIACVAGVPPLTPLRTPATQVTSPIKVSMASLSRLGSRPTQFTRKRE